MMFFFFFKQKTAYEMRISDLSSDVCSSEAALEMAKTNVKELFSAHIDAMKTGGELDDLLNYDSVDTLRAGYERIKGLDATGIFKDVPPTFAQDDPLRVYDIKALSEDEKSMFAEVLLEIGRAHV